MDVLFLNAKSRDDLLAAIEVIERVIWLMVYHELESRATSIANFRASLDEIEARLTTLELTINDATEQLRSVGMEDWTAETIDAARIRLQQELRLNEVDIAGIRASLAALQARAPSQRQNSSTAKAIDSTSDRLELELEVELAGGLGRKDQLIKELENLRAAQSAIARKEDASTKAQSARIAQQSSASFMETNVKAFNAISPLLDFEVLGRRVEMFEIVDRR